MKRTLRNLKNCQHVIYGNVGMGVIVTVAGLIQASNPLMWAGICWILVSVGLLIAVLNIYPEAIRPANPVVSGVIEGAQPALPGVRTHMQRTRDLPKAA